MVSRFTTSQGIERGLLADHQVLVMVVTDTQVRELTQAEDPHLQVGADQAVDSFVHPAGNALGLGGGQDVLGDVLAG